MKQIIAVGGGGFSMDPENPLLDTYLLEQSSKTKPHICFIPTASGDSGSYMARFYNFFENYACQPSHLSLFHPPTRDLTSFLLEKDIIFVGGGNTRNMLALWREWEVDVILKNAWEQGVILAGVSAGSICWFEEGVTDSFGGELEPLQGLGFLPGSHCPHYDGEPKRRPAYKKLMAEGKIQPGLAVDDHAAAHYIDHHLHRVVSSKPNARAYRLYHNRGIEEEELETLYLGRDE
ncbi:peptidase E [Halobacillus halophilus]|uniref:Type 1 glutamine amidotransferase-like domain-containing protein n=1 Tax=Halobacillus halophilus TaxID=1570 RepID=UPI001369B90C|nr:peptidase E [Halobacillus halophilus]MYL31252.1 peptidase E [Halobacillus halophilus]